MEYRQEQDDIISRQETMLFSYQNIIDDQQRKVSDPGTYSSAIFDVLILFQIDNLSASCANVQQLEDQLDEVKADRESLRRKANAAERYKQKLETMQGLEEEVRELQAQLDDARTKAKSTEDARQVLEGTVTKYRRTLENIEQENFELQTVKRRLELDNHALKQRCDSMNDDRLRDAEVINGLEERVHVLEVEKEGQAEKEHLGSQLAGAIRNNL
jgi:protein HOOK3